MHGRDKYWLIGLAAAVVFFAAVSITINALAPDVPTASNTSTVDARIQDSTFVVAFGSVAALTQEQSIELAHATCRDLADGATDGAVLATLEARHLSPTEAAHLIFSAVNAYCPGQRQSRSTSSTSTGRS